MVSPAVLTLTFDTPQFLQFNTFRIYYHQSSIINYNFKINLFFVALDVIKLFSVCLNQLNIYLYSSLVTGPVSLKRRKRQISQYTRPAFLKLISSGDHFH